MLVHIFLESVGALLLLWTALGWLLLRKDRGGLCIRLCRSPEEGMEFALTCMWLRQMGMIRMGTVLVPRDLEEQELQQLRHFIREHPEIRLCTAEQLEELLEREAGAHGRTGSSPGNSHRDHLSEP